MAQIIPLVAQLGSANTGLNLGYTVLNLDRTVYAAFSVTGVGESNVPGTYYVSGGVTLPDAGGYIVVGESGSDMVEVAVDAAPPAAGAVADAVLDEAMSGHTTPGTAGAALAAAGSAGDPWITDLTDGDYDDPDTAGYILARLADLDMSAVTQVAASSAGHLTITAGLTFSESVTGLTIPADWVSAIWTLKRDVRDADTAALVQLRTTNPTAVTDGLQRLNGSPPAPITVDDGDLTVNQAGGAITVWLSDELTAVLNPATALGWDVKFIDGGGDSTGQRGTADVVLTETRATV